MKTKIIRITFKLYKELRKEYRAFENETMAEYMDRVIREVSGKNDK